MRSALSAVQSGLDSGGSRSVAALHSARANGPVKGGSLSKRNEIPDRCSRVSNLRNRAQSGLVVTESPVLSAAICKNTRKEVQGSEINDGRLKQASPTERQVAYSCLWLSRPLALAQAWPN